MNKVLILAVILVACSTLWGCGGGIAGPQGPGRSCWAPLDLLGHRVSKVQMVQLETLGHKARLGQWAVEVPPEKLGSRGRLDWTVYPACPRRLFGLSYGLI